MLAWSCNNFSLSLSLQVEALSLYEQAIARIEEEAAQLKETKQMLSDMRKDLCSLAEKDLRALAESVESTSGALAAIQNVQKTSEMLP